MGIDLVREEQVDQALQRFGKAYLDRVYTSAEVACCTSARGIDALRLAARYAAKEATIKVLRTPLRWNEVEVVKDPGGWVDLVLHGSALQIARDLGASDFSVSLTHEGPWASAVVAADVPTFVERTA